MSQQAPADAFAAPLVAGEAENLLKVATESLLGHFAEMCNGAIIVDRQARIVWMNDHYPKRLGVADPAAAIGQPVENILPNSMMREVVDLDTDEIYRDLAITTNNCWVLLHRTRLALRACLGDGWFPDKAA